MHATADNQAESATFALAQPPAKLLASKAQALASRISDLRTTVERLAKHDRALVTAPGRGAALKPISEALAAAAADCLELLEEADLLPDEPFLARLIEARQELSNRNRVIHHRRSAAPAFETMRAMSRRLDTLGSDLLLCVGQPRHPWLAMYVSRVRRELGLADRELVLPVSRGPCS